VVDDWAQTDQNRLQWLRFDQKKLRAEVYNGLADALAAGDANLEDVGKRFVLPSSFIGGARNMYQLFQDSMAICRENIKPQWFFTATCNTKWREIQDELLEGQSEEDRPDLVARVFALKMKALREDLLKNGYLGHAVAHVYTIEFQKRGLPHMHLLIFIHHDDQVKEPADVDKYVSAQLPDKRTNPLLWKTVTTCILHGPCGPSNPNAQCMVDGKCSKHYPRKFQEETTMDGNGYPLYSRPDDGRTFEKEGLIFDNRSVIPYNPDLSVKYECHINTECCASVHSVKYIHKYVYKGHDRATLEIEKNLDEIKEYLDARWIGTLRQSGV
jgi:hypothetical protein